MRGSKPLQSSTLLKSWSWAKPYYEVWLDVNSKNISKINSAVIYSIFSFITVWAIGMIWKESWVRC